VDGHATSLSPLLPVIVVGTRSCVLFTAQIAADLGAEVAGD
jgi:hypothetical protein